MVELEEIIKGMMSDYRFRHTLSVAEECKNLASLFGIDEKELVTAAYLHDITKERTTEEQLEICRETGVEIHEDTLNSPKTLHSFTAPALIMRDFPEYATPTVLSAVRYHTTGRADMTLHEKLLYLADYIEPTRKFSDCKKLREYFYSSKDDLMTRLDNTLFLSLKYTINDLVENGAYIHPETIRAYNALALYRRF